jgi:hypothetical protein
VANTLSRARSSPAFFRAEHLASEPPSLLRAVGDTAIHLIAFRFGSFMHAAAPIPAVDSFGAAPHHPLMITNSCTAALSKKAPLPGTADRRAR